MRKLEYAENVVFREEPEGGILFNVDTGELRLVEGVAWGICHLIDSGAGRKEILEELGERYPEEPDLEKDLEDFLDRLREAGFLRRM